MYRRNTTNTTWSNSLRRKTTEMGCGIEALWCVPNATMWSSSHVLKKAGNTKQNPRPRECTGRGIHHQDSPSALHGEESWGQIYHVFYEDVKNTTSGTFYLMLMTFLYFPSLQQRCTKNHRHKTNHNAPWV